MVDDLTALEAHQQIETYRLTQYRAAHPAEAAAYHEEHQRVNEVLESVQRAAVATDFHEAYRWGSRAAAMLPHTMANWAVLREHYVRFCEREGFPVAKEQL